MQTLKRSNNIQPVSIEEEGIGEFRLGDDELLSRHGQDIHAEVRANLVFGVILSVMLNILFISSTSRADIKFPLVVL